MIQSDDALAAIVALTRRAGFDVPGLAGEIERVGPHELLARALHTETSLFPDDPGPLLDTAHAELSRCRQQGIQVLSVLDAGYPANLQRIHDRPALLFVAGELAQADDRAIAVIGSRSANDDELKAARTLARDLASTGHTVVSGLARGVDTAAHTAAIAAGGRTVAVIGTGLAHAYPPENAPLQRELIKNHAVLSPFSPQTRPSADGFRRRNAVMSGLSRGTVIVAAGPRSGTRVQARRALAHGRPVFLLPGVTQQPWAAALATRPNVHVVASAAEVVATTDRLSDPLEPFEPAHR